MYADFAPPICVGIRTLLTYILHRFQHLRFGFIAFTFRPVTEGAVIKRFVAKFFFSLHTHNRYPGIG
jgi:hypothetical protein